ncbi:MAG: glycerol-3-phosphate 1-O-acyltransferase PlsY [Desulfuromonadaceae bacterium]|nr:glycerol-3-phosphate 1-O-acyltransferase PlsY [Desulfuromonas sp.]MDY0185409.1 glycerol-3-phosphate 1-O-acyltransferase PlsY [Desulfuromonadaceae bacterium]
MEIFGIVALAYLIGAIPSGVILTRMAGIADIRRLGSGNVGATNVYRVAGKRLGILTLILDILKGVLPLLLLQYLLDSGTVTAPGLETSISALAALALFGGHCYPVYLRFKGGKGVATALGVFLVLAPLALLPSLVVFILVLWRWRYVSLASISAATVLPFTVLGGGYSWALVLVTCVIAAVVVYRHRGNIERLRLGSESRFSF